MFFINGYYRINTYSRITETEHHHWQSLKPQISVSHGSGSNSISSALSRGPPTSSKYKENGKREQPSAVNTRWSGGKYKPLTLPRTVLHQPLVSPCPSWRSGQVEGRAQRRHDARMTEINTDLDGRGTDTRGAHSTLGLNMYTEESGSQLRGRKVTAAFLVYFPPTSAIRVACFRAISLRVITI